MTIRTFAIATILALAPTFALSQGCNSDHEQASSCAEGYAWDAAAGSCVAQVNS